MSKELDATWDIPCELDERPSFIIDVFLKEYGNKK